MLDASPVLAVAPELLREAASERGWDAVLGRLALAPTDANVRAFRRRAVRLGIPVGHLRWRGGLEDVAADTLRAAADGALSRREVLERLALQPGGRTYADLERACNRHGVELPPRRSYRTTAPSCCTDDEVRAAFAESRSMADLLRRVGLVPRGDNYRVMRLRLERLGLDATRLKGQAWSRGQRRSRALEELLVAGRACSGPVLMRQLLEAGYLERACVGCDLVEWLSEPIPLELDHINGDHTDNRLENLRLLCPNCHAQTNTYRGRNVRRRRSLRLQPEC
jgi:hypothetical protein